MALRVLLADESVTIKKVFQLSLQDYGVDVFAVTSGLDVLPVAKKNPPDIVFVDVILPKKSGYDVAAEIKKDPQLRNIPVVIIWSGFMELDQARFVACHADAHLEKPFDTQKLRHVVQSLVKKTQTQNLSDYLQFPKLPDFRDEPAPTLSPSGPLGSAPKKAPALPDESNILSMRNQARPAPPQNSQWNMDHFAPVPSGTSLTQVTNNEDGDGDFSELADDFVPVELPANQPSRAALKRSESIKQFTAPEPSATDDNEDGDNQWVQKTLSRYKVEVSEADEREPEIEYQEPVGKIDADEIIRDDRNSPPKVPAQKAAPKPSAKPAPQTPAPSQVRQHSVSSITHEYERDDDDESGEIELDLGEPTETRVEHSTQLTEKQLEAIIRAQSKEMIEKVIWQVVPEIATQIIEREIQRLLKERQDIGPR